MTNLYFSANFFLSFIDIEVFDDGCQLSTRPGLKMVVPYSKSDLTFRSNWVLGLFARPRGKESSSERGLGAEGDEGAKNTEEVIKIKVFSF